MPQHRAVSPDDCPSCRRLFAALQDHLIADPHREQGLTTEEVGKAASLKKRAAQVHLAHLFAHSRIDADRRTPLAATVGEPVLPGAQEWAASVVAPDPTCAKCLVALAAWGWEGQVSMEELAEAAGISLRSVERHRPHLVRADLAHFRAVTVAVGPTGYRQRKADRFTLLSSVPAAKLTGAAWDQAPARAAAVVERVCWFVGVTGEERALAEASVTWCLRNGWPEEALIKALDASEDRHAYHPNGYLAKLLRKLPPRYIVPAQEVYTGRSAPRVIECAICRNPFKTSMSGHVLCGGAVCLEAADIPAQSTPARITKTA